MNRLLRFLPVTLFVVAVSFHQAAEAQVAVSVQRWGNAVEVFCRDINEKGSKYQQRINASLMAHGQQGWELISFSQTAITGNVDCFVAAFRRPL